MAGRPMPSIGLFVALVLFGFDEVYMEREVEILNV